LSPFLSKFIPFEQLIPFLSTFLSTFLSNIQQKYFFEHFFEYSKSTQNVEYFFEYFFENFFEDFFETFTMIKPTSLFQAVNFILLQSATNDKLINPASILV